MKRKNFLIVVPVYNEEKHIEKVIYRILDNIKKSDTDILIINDGSTDNTSEILKKINFIKLINHKTNLGYGKSLIDGFKYGIENKYKYIITMDCDEQHQPHQIKDFIKEIFNSDYDIVSGSRYKNINPELLKIVPKNRYKINRKILKKINKITKFNLTDAFCGFKAYKVASLKKLNLTEKGYGMPVQLWIQAKNNNFKIKEISVDLIYIDFSRNFNNKFNSSKKRYKYYLKVLKKELRK